MITDDETPDAFNEWTQQITADEWVELTEKYAVYYHQILQVNTELKVPKIKSVEEWLNFHFSEHIAPEWKQPNEDTIRDQMLDDIAEQKAQEEEALERMADRAERDVMFK